MRGFLDTMAAVGLFVLMVGYGIRQVCAIVQGDFPLARECLLLAIVSWIGLRMIEDKYERREE